MLGSILSNILLVLGCSFIAGSFSHAAVQLMVLNCMTIAGFKYKESHFQAVGAQAWVHSLIIEGVVISHSSSVLAPYV